MIKRISIENIKGFGSPAKDLDVTLMSGKPNIVVAPNGFGKSTICRAFDCLKEDGIVLGDTDFHGGNKALQPSFKIVIDDGTEYVTDKTKNEIYAHFQCFCINSPLKPTSVVKRIAGQRNYTTNSLDIESVVLNYNTPLVKTLFYSSSDYKAAFGGNGRKVLPNINGELWKLCRCPQAEFESLNGARRRKKIQEVMSYINSLSGSADTISASVGDVVFSDLTAIQEYQTVSSIITRTFGATKQLDIFLIFWILFRLYNNDRKLFKQATLRNRFNRYVDTLNHSMQALDTTWVGVQAVEEDRKLIIKFPKAGNISYGQRDSLYLFASLERIKIEIDRTRPVILIVDELFDYLDMVNMTIIQYFFSEFINYCKKNVEIYPIILTHLSPEYYHNYTFSKMNIQYLGDGSGITDTPTKKLLKARGVDAASSAIYTDVSRYLLHYHTGAIDKEAEFMALRLRKKWGKGHGFVEYLAEECNKYFANQPYDYYAITTAVRIRVEKIAFCHLPTEEARQAFLDKNGTRKKFEEAEKWGVDIPDVFSLLGIIYNDAEHLPQNSDADKAIIYRLNNLMIRHMIHSIFDDAGQIDSGFFI